MALVSLTVGACGGGSSDGNVVTTPVGDPPPVDTVPAVQLRRVFEQLAFLQPVALKHAPGDASRWFVVEKGGTIRVFANNANSSSTSVFLDISPVVNSLGEGGLLGMAFHPNFPLTPEVYVSYTRSEAPLKSYVSRFFSTDNGQTLNAGTEQVLLTLSQPESNHNGGDVQFGPDGNLYIAFGDGGGVGDPRGYAQDTGNLHGTIVRLDVDGTAPYEIPSGNPFFGNGPCTQGFGGAACPEIFAWGLRNPWRFSFDSATGKLWAGDVGQGAWEEVDVINAGQNYGWNVREGANCYPPGSSCGSTFTEPVAQYDHSAGDRSITGGFVYRGTAIPGLVDWYVFGDFVSGRI
ncbi:MAG: hypothetical protein HKN64_00590, partial [Woeseiaceae bacterium]|nr:hypothetical protein [Woeseiaceae bacterium]